jgi:hypothetical protein
LGNLWTDLLQTPQTVPARNCFSIGASQRINSIPRNEEPSAEDELLDDRPMSPTRTFRPATWLVDLRKRLPFPLLGIDSDNGSEFINDTLYRYCLQEGITFTRSRPYKKNDQAHIEQKNWSVVRRLVGYDRFETEEELALLKVIYQDHRLYVNFFQPVLKLIEKHRIGSKVIKRYDQATTPFRRVLASPDVSLEDKIHLQYQFIQLNPVTLRNKIDDNIAILWKINR